MKLITKQFNRQYKNRHYFFYVRKIFLGRFKTKWKFWGWTNSNQAKNAIRRLQSCGYEWADWK